MAIMEKVKGVLHQRDDMRLQMEEAFTAKEAVSPEADLLVVYLCAVFVETLDPRVQNLI